MYPRVLATADLGGADSPPRSEELDRILRQSELETNGRWNKDPDGTIWVDVSNAGFYARDKARRDEQREKDERFAAEKRRRTIDQERIIRTALAAATAGLLLAAILELPGGYYSFLRWFALGSSLLLSMLVVRAGGWLCAGSRRGGSPVEPFCPDRHVAWSVATMGRSWGGVLWIAGRLEPQKTCARRKGTTVLRGSSRGPEVRGKRSRVCGVRRRGQTPGSAERFPPLTGPHGDPKHRPSDDSYFLVENIVDMITAEWANLS